MGFSNQFFEALGIDPNSKEQISKFSKKTSIPVKQLKYYNNNNVIPSGNDLDSIITSSELDYPLLMLKMGILDKDLINAIRKHANEISEVLKPHLSQCDKKDSAHELVFKTRRGKLFQGDCISVAKSLKNDSIDLVFADPPFNLDKLYPSKIDDNLKTEKYIHWCHEWLTECIRILKPGGSIFLWNLPIWNTILSSFMNDRLTFKHWISVDIKYSLPISGKLYPSHYSLLYFTKGEKANTFHPDRLPMQTCPKCLGDLKDYGGYKHKMNPSGISLTDVWLDINPVRHAKYKRRTGANELPIKLMDRIIEMSTDKKDVVFDPFGGSGTTYVTAELKDRKWIGCEIGPVDDIINRFDVLEEERQFLKESRKSLNALFPAKILEKREKKGLWTPESVRNKVNNKIK